jgi:S-adenosylmethionine hydrolase
MAAPTIAFLSDFGTRDHYVGAMKGAALTICPDATLAGRDGAHWRQPQGTTSLSRQITVS